MYRILHISRTVNSYRVPTQLVNWCRVYTTNWCSIV